mmetsp:Transcript_100968/g.324150  ORF Transcript_100968/g.324150 Transcript_100968/m.324150 type:complete len:209 (-) Transcript_100968:1433-2059(-)
MAASGTIDWRSEACSSRLPVSLSARTSRLPVWLSARTLTSPFSPPSARVARVKLEEMKSARIPLCCPAKAVDFRNIRARSKSAPSWSIFMAFERQLRIFARVCSSGASNPMSTLCACRAVCMTRFSASCSSRTSSSYPVPMKFSLCSSFVSITSQCQICSRPRLFLPRLPSVEMKLLPFGNPNSDMPTPLGSDTLTVTVQILYRVRTG